MDAQTMIPPMTRRPNRNRYRTNSRPCLTRPRHPRRQVASPSPPEPAVTQGSPFEVAHRA